MCKSLGVATNWVEQCLGGEEGKNHQARANSVIQVDRDSDMGPASQLNDKGGFSIGTMISGSTFLWREVPGGRYWGLVCRAGVQQAEEPLLGRHLDDFMA